MEILQGTGISEFVLDGVTSPQAVHEAAEKRILDFADEYLDHIKPPAKAESTWALEKYHLGHLKAFLDIRRSNPLL